MGSSPVGLPPGFQLEEQPTQLPPGFQLEQQVPQEQPGILQRLFGGPSVLEQMHQQRQSIDPNHAFPTYEQAIHNPVGLGVDVAPAPGMAGARGLLSRSVPTAEETAKTKVLQAFKRDQTTAQDVGAQYQLNQMVNPKPEVLADYAGENTRGLARAASGVPGPAKGQMGKALTDRMVGDITKPFDSNSSAYRVGKDAARVMGIEKSYEANALELDLSRKAAADPAYKVAYEAGGNGVWSDKLAELMHMRPSLKRAWSRAQEIAAEAGEPLPKTSLVNGRFVTADGSVVTPNLRMWDYMKRGLYDNLKKEKKESGVATDLGREMNGTFKQLRDELVRLVPQYGDALAVWSGPSRNLEAMETGLNVLKMSPQTIRQELRSMEPGEKEFFKVGVSQAVADKADLTRGAGDVMNRLAVNDATRKQLATAMGDREYVAFIKELGREHNQAITTARVTGGSPTEPRLQESADLVKDATRIIMQLKGGNLGAPFAYAAGKVAEKFQQRGLTPEVADEIRKLIADPDQAEKALMNLQLFSKARLRKYPLSKTAIFSATQVSPTRQD